MAAFGLIGKIDPFDETIEPWESYVERFEQYFTVNEIDPEKRYRLYYVSSVEDYILFCGT